MGRFESFLRGVDSVASPLLYEKLYGLALTKPSLKGQLTARGVDSIFDYAAGYSNSGTYDELPHIGRMTVNEVTDYFKRNLCLLEKQPFECDLSDIRCLTMSKSDLRAFSSLESFGEHNYTFHRTRETNVHLTEDEYFHKCISEALAENSSIRFSKYQWEPYLTWSNSGGSHRFSTAFSMSISQQRKFPLKVCLHRYSLNLVFLNLLVKDYDCFLIELGIDGSNLLFNLFDIHHSNNTYIRIPNIRSNSKNENILLLIHKSERTPGFSNRWLSWLHRNELLINFEEVFN